VFGVVVAAFSLYMAYSGPSIHYGPIWFYHILVYELFFILVPIWMLIMAAYFLGFRRTSNRTLGLVAGIGGLVSGVASFLVLFVLVYSGLTTGYSFGVSPEYWGWYTMLTTWFDATLVGGVALVLFGIVYLKVSSGGKRNPFGLLAGLLYIAIGVFGILIGLGPATAALAFFNDFSLIPWMYGLILFPSLLSLKA
jgi:hypothetical protein